MAGMETEMSNSGVWIYENWQAHGHRAKVHRAECSFCNSGQGLHPGAGSEHGKWHGPFPDAERATEAARATGAEVTHCLRCKPGRLGVPEPGTPLELDGRSGTEGTRRPAFAQTEFTLLGQSMSLSRDDVIEKLKSRTPGPIRKHAVEVEGRLFSIKEAFSLVTGTDPLDANTAQARSVLQRLGFRVLRIGTEVE
jgi:hypothetical protein